jgi:hypothetical protein
MHPPAWAAPRREKYRYVKMLAFTTVSVFLAGWTIASVLPRPSKLQVPLRFTENGSFQISIFEDLHTGEGTSYAANIGGNFTDTCQSPGSIGARYKTKIQPLS